MREGGREGGREGELSVGPWFIMPLICFLSRARSMEK